MGTAAKERVGMMERFVLAGFVNQARYLLACVLLTSIVPLVAFGNEGQARFIVVLGAPGEVSYAEEFRQAAQRIRESLKDVDFELIDGTSDVGGSTTDREQLLVSLKGTQKDSRVLWIILIGHGTFDGKLAKFNMRGPDLTPTDLNDALQENLGPQVIVNASSCSVPFINQLSRENRVIVTATKSGSEVNYSRFGRFFAESIGDPKSDLDHDNAVSILEAFLSASSRVRNYYQEESRLATEQALLDDNGDKRGTPASFFRGMRVQEKAKDGATVDGSLARKLALYQNEGILRLTEDQVMERDRIETELESLRLRKSELSEEEYYAQLEKLMLELAAVLVSKAK
jgi:hypothetical protein